MGGLAQNITGKVITDSGMRLMEGLETYNAFPFVTETKMWISKNVQVRLANSANANIDYIANYNHISQFSTSTSALMVDGGSYANNMVAKSGQMVAPVECYLKNVIGWINPHACSGCDEGEGWSIVLSIWKKPVTDDGTATTVATLLFQQEFTTLAGQPNTYCVKIDGTTDSRVGDNTNKVDAEDGIVVSIRWAESEAESACCNINANFEMTFETIASETTTTEEILLPSLTVDGFNRYNETVSVPNRANVIRPPETT
jgi:hypothetical protein